MGVVMEFVFFWIICAVLCAIIASSKGRSGFGWFVLGGLFSVIALLLVIVLPSIKPPVDLADAPSPDSHVKCPDCRELVIKDARKCKHCATTLIPQA
jgi:hypothetical protein